MRFKPGFRFLSPYEGLIESIKGCVGNLKIRVSWVKNANLSKFMGAVVPIKCMLTYPLSIFNLIQSPLYALKDFTQNQTKSEFEI